MTKDILPTFDLVLTPHCIQQAFKEHPISTMDANWLESHRLSLCALCWFDQIKSI
jgi:hypothetical protein